MPDENPAATACAWQHGAHPGLRDDVTRPADVQDGALPMALRLSEGLGISAGLERKLKGCVRHQLAATQKCDLCFRERGGLAKSENNGLDSQIVRHGWTQEMGVLIDRALCGSVTR